MANVRGNSEVEPPLRQVERTLIDGPGDRCRNMIGIGNCHCNGGSSSEKVSDGRRDLTLQMSSRSSRRHIMGILFLTAICR